MDERLNIKPLLDHIRLSEGPGFECDEKAILEKVRKREGGQSSLSIKVLSIFGGFLATIVFLGFLAIAGLYESEIGILLFGTGFIISAIGLNRAYDKLIIDTFSIAIYISGLAMFSFGLLKMEVDENIVAIFVIIVALSSLLLTQNFILSFVSILAISSSCLTLIISNDFYDLIHLYVAATTLILTYFFLNEAKVLASSKWLSQLYGPIKIGSIFSLLFGLIIIGNKHLIPLSQNRIWLSSIVMILVILYLVHSILKINEVGTIKSKFLVYSLSVCLLMSTLFSPAISGAMAIILLCFLVNYRTGFAIGVMALLYFVSQYYYDLNLTLLTKSLILMASGVTCLLLYLFISIKLNNEKV